MDPRAILLLALAITLLPTAAAQQQGSLVVEIEGGDHVLSENAPVLVLRGTATLTTDATALLATTGIPADIKVDTPDGVIAAVSSTLVFWTAQTPPVGANVVAIAPFTLTIALVDAPTQDLVSSLEVTVKAMPSTLGATSFVGRGQTPFEIDISDATEACDDDADADAPIATQASGITPIARNHGAPTLGFAVAALAFIATLRRRA